MRKAILFLLGLGLAGASLADTLPTIPLFTAAKGEVYKYAYPEGASKVDAPMVQNTRSLDFSLVGDKASGGGIGVDKQRAADYVANGAFEFYVRGGAGADSVSVGFVQAKGLDPKDLAFEVLLPLGNYVQVSSKWTKVTIPLKDFPQQGSRWIDAEARRATGDFNWNRLFEFVVSRDPASAGMVNISFANLAIVGSYDPSKIVAPKIKAAAPMGSVSFYAEGADSVNGGGLYAYPEGSTAVDSSPGHASKLALKVDLLATAWSGAGIFHNPVDLSSFKDSGVLELWAKGAKGGEEVYFGLVSKSNGMTVRLSCKNYAADGLKTSWQKIQIPLKDFPSDGAKWDATSQKSITAPFDWSTVQEVMLDNNGPNNITGSIFLDDVVIKDKP